MNIVIVGAGGVGRYVAMVLSKEEHNVILVDIDEKKLEYASRTVDVAIKKGSGTDWQLLDNLLELSPDFLIALTTDDETNLVCCSLAKHLGYPKTIARISSNQFLNRVRLDFAQIFDVDYFIGPEILVAYDLLKYIQMPGSLTVENFAQGAVQLRTILVPSYWKQGKTPLKDLKLPKGVIVGLIRREVQTETRKEQQVIFPHGQTTLMPGDEATFIGETDVIVDIHKFLGVKEKRIQSCVIAGGTVTGLNLAKILEAKGIEVRIIENNFETCRMLAEEIPTASILNHNPKDFEFLKAEKIERSDCFIACTEHDELNLLTCLLAKQIGCLETIMTVNDISLEPMLAELGIGFTVSARVSAADHILSQIMGGKVASLVSFYDNEAEVMEVSVSVDSKVIGIPLSELGPILPEDLLIAIIQNRGRIMIADGKRIISPGDTVILITHPRHVKELETIF